MAQKDRFYSPCSTPALTAGAAAPAAPAAPGPAPALVARATMHRACGPLPTKNALFEQLIYKNDHFANTGSGQA